MEEKKLTDEELKQAFFILRHGSSEGLSEYIKAVLAIESEYDRQKAEIERLTEERNVAGYKNGTLIFDKSNLQARNAELQKQVDELKEENGKLVTIGNGFALERNNLREELDELKKRGNVVLLTSLYKKQADDHKRGLSVQRAYWEKQVQKSVKDTAREICLKIIKDQPQPIKEKWVEWFKKEYGVEVE